MTVQRLLLLLVQGSVFIIIIHLTKSIFLSYYIFKSKLKVDLDLSVSITQAGEVIDVPFGNISKVYLLDKTWRYRHLNSKIGPVLPGYLC